MIRALVSVAALAVGGIAAVACIDPVHDNEVAALGPEAPGVSPGPTHRPGQPCVICHGGSGPGNAQFSMGGTIYQAQDNTVPLVNGSVTITDSESRTFTATTNEVGNFYIELSQWAPVYPARIAVTGDGAEADMQTHISRDGSCAGCHYDPPGPTTEGHVYLVLDPSDLGTGDGGM